MLRHERKARSKGYTFIAGVDEAGRGSLAGPVVAGAVVLKTTKLSSRIDDSKRLTATARQKAYKEILKNAFIGVGIIPHTTIDRINIYQATIRAMEKALANLKIRPDIILIDGNVKIRTKRQKKNIISGDAKSMSIAAASIIAKVTRDNLMTRLHKKFPQYGFARHKGYGTRRHIFSLRKHGPSPIHRLSFKVK